MILYCDLLERGSFLGSLLEPIFCILGFPGLYCLLLVFEVDTGNPKCSKNDHILMILLKFAASDFLQHKINTPLLGSANTTKRLKMKHRLRFVLVF